MTEDCVRSMEFNQVAPWLHPKKSLGDIFEPRGSGSDTMSRSMRNGDAVVYLFMPMATCDACDGWRVVKVWKLNVLNVTRCSECQRHNFRLVGWLVASIHILQSRNCGGCKDRQAGERRTKKDCWCPHWYRRREDLFQ